MTWREDLRRVTLPDGRRLIGASFRGVPFFVAVAERTGGRRGVNHTFPLRDDNFFQDLGRAERMFPVEGYVLGDDYLRLRDRLLSALEDVAGPGELVHPYYGLRSAVATRFSTRERTVAGGMAEFAIEFTETPVQPPAPSEEPDLIPLVGDSATAAQAANQAEFLERYDPSGMPSFALESASRALASMSDDMRRALGPAVQATQELALLDSQLRIITAQASSLVRQPGEVLAGLLGAIAGLTETVLAAPGAVMNAFLQTYGAFLGPLAPETTATRKRERANQEALFDGLRRVAAIEAARLAPRVPYQSIEEALFARDQVAAQLEEQAGTAGDTAFPALVQLRADVLRAVPSQAVHARVVTVTRRVSVPSLLLSYQLYGSVAQEADLIARNGVRHPAFMSGDLKALSDG